MVKYSKISNGLFIKNRSKLKSDLLPDSSVIVFSADEMPRNGDQYYKFRQSSDLFYLTGINQSKTILLMNPHHAVEKYREILFIEKSNSEQMIWYGKKLSMEEASDISGIKFIYWLDEFEKILPEIIQQSSNIYFNLPENFKIKPEIEYGDERKARKIKSLFPVHSYQNLAPLLRKLRSIKEPEEIELIKIACDITKKAFLRILNLVKPGMPEYEIEAEITKEFIANGRSEHAYEPIIAGGKNACTLHYIENKDICKDGDLVLMDFGAEYNNYASDLSRTIPINGKFSKRQTELYDSTLRIFKFAKALLKPGILIADFNSQVCAHWQEEHIKLGLYTIKDVKNHKGESPLWFQYYMHGTSHSIGLDVHDTSDKTEKLQPGMVLSCEPGIYIEKEGVGIRLENDILITKDGNLDLMADIPIEREEIAELMRR